MTEQIVFPREKVESWAENPYVWFGTNHRGNGTMYVLPGIWTDVTDYRADNPGARFVINGVQFRNVDTPHQRRRINTVSLPVYTK